MIKFSFVFKITLSFSKYTNRVGNAIWKISIFPKCKPSNDQYAVPNFEYLPINSDSPIETHTHTHSNYFFFHMTLSTVE